MQGQLKPLPVPLQRLHITVPILGLMVVLRMTLGVGNLMRQTVIRANYTQTRVNPTLIPCESLDKQAKSQSFIGRS